MDAEPLYCAEQIRVPDVLPDVLKQWTKEVIRQNPSDVLAFSAKYFEQKAAEKRAETREREGTGK